MATGRRMCEGGLRGESQNGVRNVDPVLGPRGIPVKRVGSGKRPPFFCFCPPLPAQVSQAWSWWNLYAAAVPTGKQLLGINMDETAIRFFMQQRGLVVRRARGRCRRPATQRCSRAQMRACITLVAFVATEPRVQGSLPQVFVGAEHVLRVTDVNLVQPALTDNIRLLRRKSGWVNKELLCEIMQLLGGALAPWLREFQPVLLMDALAAHLAPSVLRAAAAAGAWVLPLPAKTTWLLQPLDTHVFATYKQVLRRKYVEFMANDREGRVHACHVLLAAHNACVEILQQREHRHAFVHNGFGDTQCGVRQSILAELQVTRVTPAVPRLPSYGELQAYLGSRTDICLESLFARCIPRRVPAARAAPRDAGAQDSSAEVPPWSARLRRRRSESQQSLDPPPAASRDSLPAVAQAHAVPQPQWPPMAMAEVLLVGVAPRPHPPRGPTSLLARRSAQ